MALSVSEQYQGGPAYTRTGTLTSTPLPQQYGGPINNLLNQLSPNQFNPYLSYNNPMEMLLTGSAQQQAGLQQQYGFGQERLGLQYAQLGMSKEQLARQQAMSPQLRALQEKGFGLSAEDLAASELGAWRGAESAQRGLTSSATARGALQTEGTRQGFTDIQRGLQAQLEGIGRERGRLDISKEQARLGYEEEQAQLADQTKNLDLMGKQLGISGREAQANLDRALQQLQLSTALSAGDIARAVQQQIATGTDPLGGITGQIISLAFGG